MAPLMATWLVGNAIVVLRLCVSVDVPIANLTCGQPVVEPHVSLTRIVSGVEARKNSWPWLCLILIDHHGTGTAGVTCVGSVIDSRHILTAASCV